MKTPQPVPSVKSGRIAIIAGNGSLPAEIYRELIESDRAPVLIGIANEIAPEFAPKADAILTFGQLGKLFEIFSKKDVRQVIFAGGIKKRPDFKRLKLDITTVKELPTLLKIAMGGDNSVLMKIATYFEKRDLEVIGAHQALPQLLALEGNLVGRPSTKVAGPSMDRAFAAAKTIGALDAGQAAICEDGRIVALEGAEGTDAMIARVKTLRANGEISIDPKASVLAKVMKPKQDMRADLPAIGPQTIRNLSEAGIKGVVLEAGRSLVLERTKTLSAAKKAGIFITAITQDGAVK